MDNENKIYHDSLSKEYLNSYLEILLFPDIPSIHLLNTAATQRIYSVTITATNKIKLNMTLKEYGKLVPIFKYNRQENEITKIITNDLKSMQGNYAEKSISYPIDVLNITDLNFKY